MFKLLHRYLGNARSMKQVLVYKGLGMYEDDTAIIERVMKEHVNSDLYKVDTVSPEEIVRGRLLSDDTALLVIGGGYDLGLIEALGTVGMANLKQYVTAGGSYLGICAGAYFACDSIEFDKGGPMEVVGERSLKFYSGVGIGPLFKPYDYKSRKGACAVNIDFSLQPLNQSVNKGNQPVGAGDQTVVVGNQHGNQSNESSHCQNEQKDSQNLCQESQSSIVGGESQIEYQKESHLNVQNSESRSILDADESHLAESLIFSGNSSTFNCKVYFNGGCYFKMNDEGISNGTRVLSRYLDLPDSPAAIVRCQVQAGVAVLCGAHLEYDPEDIDDGDTDVTDIIPCLRESSNQRRAIMKSILQQLNITVNH